MVGTLVVPMTAAELLRTQIDDAGYQLGKVLEGVREEDLDTKVESISMTLRQHVEHLCESYVAAATELHGGHHEWGTFALPNRSIATLLDTFNQVRNDTAQKLLSAEGDQGLHLASAYIVLHDGYHVGQLCALRQAIDSSWSSFSIYPS
jgi:uncharacterized damage-inducible protein DinB